MSKIITVIILINLLIHPLFAGEIKTKEDFDPPPPVESPIISFIPDSFNPVIGLAVSLTAAVSGMTLLTVNMHIIAVNALDNPGSVDVHKRIILTGISLIGTTVSLIITELFINRLLF